MYVCIYIICLYVYIFILYVCMYVYVCICMYVKKGSMYEN